MNDRIHYNNHNRMDFLDVEKRPRPLGIEMMISELLGMALGLFLGIALIGYIVWNLLDI
jgi:hypothetical protein